MIQIIGDAGSILSSESSYWVAARYVNSYTSDNYTYFGIRLANTNLGGHSMFRSDKYNNYNYSSRLRPVVSLNLNVLTGRKDEDGAWKIKTTK